MEKDKLKESFSFQWDKLPSSSTAYNSDRIEELLSFTKLKRDYFKGKKCFDIGCGNGRYTYALKELGADVYSIDINPIAVKLCKKINPQTEIMDLYDLEPSEKYDFVLCWGVLHHLHAPMKGFGIISDQVKVGGVLHIMVYNRKSQSIYIPGRNIWPSLSIEERINYCKQMIKKHGGNLHGWYDAFNPIYNFSYHPIEIRKWFKNEDYKKIVLTKRMPSINMRGIKK